jgi:hypothetical protein
MLEMLVSTWRAMIDAPATAAPDGSVTRPDALALLMVSCAEAVSVTTLKQAGRRMMKTRIRMERSDTSCMNHRLEC